MLQAKAGSRVRGMLNALGPPRLSTSVRPLSRLVCPRSDHPDEYASRAARFSMHPLHHGAMGLLRLTALASRLQRRLFISAQARVA